MSHVMGHVDVTYTKGKIRDAQAEFAEYIEECMMESGSDEGGVYDTKTTWHPDLVYDTWKEACDAVDGMAGFYHCHAVLYHDMDVDYDEVDATPASRNSRNAGRPPKSMPTSLSRLPTCIIASSTASPATTAQAVSVSRTARRNMIALSADTTCAVRACSPASARRTPRPHGCMTPFLRSGTKSSRSSPRTPR